ncbi:PepSY-associated TM helix domain-containing protein [Roseibium sp.]|uniref:PepSY-associated TM helix domain-containing protein n=1 Tax=Roseibium sp. TaxID=1936156 RepID=UPI003D142323
MSFKRTIFWSHLVIGVAFGLVILMMSVTGVLLTYERQIVTFLENRMVERPEGFRPLGIDALAAKALENGAQPGNSLVISNQDGAAARISVSRRENYLLNPYTGDRIENAAQDAKAFFRTLTSLHRWFALTGESRAAGKAVTGAANLGFLFLLASGLYLWWPKSWKWRIVRTNLLFRRNLPTSKARDYNWHHVFGIWALVPLFAVVLTGVVISYPWAGTAVTAVFGPADPAHAGRSAGGPLQARQGKSDGFTSLQEIADTIALQEPAWNTLSIKLPRDKAARVLVTADTGNGVQLSRQTTYAVARTSGEILDITRPEDQSSGRRAQVFLRFLHTGEVYGVAGQTIAGLGSLAAVFLFYTGFALAYRRLIQPVFRRRIAGSTS